MTRAEQRILDAVRAHPGRDAKAIAAGLGMPFNTYNHAVRRLRDVSAVTLHSEIVPVATFTDWHLLTDKLRDVVLAVCDGKATVEALADDLGLTTRGVANRIGALRDLGALHPAFGVWTAEAADAQRDAVWSAYAAWSKGARGVA